MKNFIKNNLRNFYVKYSLPMSVYFDESIDKKILICYIKSPFYFMNRPIKHSNVIESRIIADTFKNMGFNVDVVDWQCKRNIDYSKYSLIFGFGLPYRNSFSNHDINLKRICYLTGSNPNFSNKQEAMRIKKIYDDKKSLLSPRREAYWPWMNTAINSDMLVLTGNSQTKSTYEGLVENIQTVPVPIIPSKLKPNLSINSGILWFGGSGAVHKGLDLVLEAITNSSAKFTLDICGPIKGETDFFNMYQEKLNDERVNFHGMIDVSSNEMQKLIDRNSFIVLPSCSEGMASSVITCMQFGLIPIISKECGVDIGDHGILIEELSISGVKTAIYKALNLNADEILKMKKQAVEFIKKNNSHDSYRKHILNALKNFKNNTKY